MSKQKQESTFTKVVKTKAKNPRTWEISYRLVDGPPLQAKKHRAPAQEPAEQPAATAEAEDRPKTPRRKRGKTEAIQGNLPFSR